MAGDQIDDILGETFGLERQTVQQDKAEEQVNEPAAPPAEAQVHEPSHAGLEQQQLDQPYTNPKTGRVSPGVVLPAQPPAEPVEQLGQEPSAPALQPGDIDATLAAAFPAETAAHEQAGRLAWKASSTSMDPATAREALVRADQTGADPEYIAQNLDEYRKNDTEGAFEQPTRASPLMAQWADESSLRPAAIKDDLPHLSLLQRAVTDPWHASVDFWKDSGRAVLHMPEAFEDSMYQQAQAVMQLQDFAGQGDDKNTGQVEAIEKERGSKDYGVRGQVGKALLAIPKMLPLVVGDMVSRSLGGAVGEGAGKAIALGAELAGGGPEDPVADTAAGAAMVAAPKVGEYLGSAVFNAGESLGPIWWRLRTMKDQDGNPLDPTVARVFAATAATANGALMSVAGGPLGERLTTALGSFVSKVPGGKALLAKASVEAIAQDIAQSSMATAANRLVARHGAHVLSGALLMGMQGAINSAGEEAAKAESGQPFDVRPSNALSAFRDSFLTGTRDMFLMAGMSTYADAQRARADAGGAGVVDDIASSIPSPDSGRVVLEEKGRRASSEQGAQQLRELVDAAAQSKVAKEAPGQLQDLLSRAKQEPGASKAVYVDKGAWDRLWQTEDEDPAEAAKKVVGDNGEAYAQASTTGGEVVVPVEKFAALAAERPELARKVLDDARRSPDEDSPRAMREGDEKLQARAAELAKVKPDEMDESARRVYDDFYAKAKGGGASHLEADANARLVSASMRSWSERFTEAGQPLHPWDIYAGNNDVAIKGRSGQGLGFGDFSGQGAEDTSFDFGANAQPEEHQAIADVRREYEGHLNRPDTEAALRRYMEDPVTGLRNEQAAAMAPEDEAKPLVLHFGSEGIKFRNDDLKVGGHNKADQLLRAVADAAHQIDPNVFRAGGDFAVPVASEAEGEAFLAKLRDTVPVQARGYGITGAVGKDLTAARTAHDLLKEGMEQRGERSTRGERPKGLPEGQNAGSFIPGKRVRAKLLAEHHEKFADLVSTREGREQAFKEVHVEKGTGILRKQGFDARPPKKYRAAIDLNGLKRVQEKLLPHLGKEQAHAFGDLMLETFGQMAEAADGLDFDFAHDHGDEYLAQSDNEQELKSFLSKLRDDSAEKISVRQRGTKDGVAGTWVYKKLMFGFGTGETAHENEAELNLNADKQDLSKRGLRGNEDQPGRLDFIPDEGVRPEGGAGDLDRAAEGGQPQHEPRGAAGGSAEGGPRGNARTDRAGEAAEEGAHPGDGASGDRAGEGEGSPPGQLDVAPGVKLHNRFSIPTEQEMTEARDWAETLGPANRARVEGFLDRVGGYLAGKNVRQVVGDLPRELENELAARFGITDPERGYPTTDDLRHASRGGQRRKPGASSMRDAMGRPLAGDENIKRLRKANVRGGDADKLESRKGRGFIEFSPAGTSVRRQFEISLLAKADKSTLAHETFHFLSEVMGDLAQDPSAPEQVKKDYDALLKHMGYASHEKRLSLSEERRDLDAKAMAAEDGHGPALTDAQKARRRTLHAKEEKATGAWEQYLLEGKAPSAELAGVFTRFRGWLVRIYKSVLGLQQVFRRSYGEDLELSDDTRQVFDRILASDQEIERTYSGREQEPPAGVVDGMTPAERAEYEEARGKEKEEAKIRLARAIAGDQKAERTGYMKLERARLERETAEDLDQQPTYRALRFLQDGDLPEAPGEVPPLLAKPDGEPKKLDRDAAGKLLGPDFLKGMPRGIFGAKGEGISPDELAPHVGFETGEQLLRAIHDAEPRRARIKREAQERLEELYRPSLIDSPDQLATAALDAVHNEAGVKRVLLERRAMVRRLAPSDAARAPELHPDTLRRTAEKTIASKTVGDLTEATRGRGTLADYYLRAERAAARKVREAAEAGNTERALDENQNQLLNMHLWRAAKDAQQKLEGQRRLLDQAGRGPWQQALGKADVAAGGDHAYRDATNAILQAVGTQPAPAGGLDVRALDPLQQAAGGNGLGFDVDAVKQLLASPKEWAGLSGEQAQTVVDAVKAIRHAASSQNALEIEGQRIDKAQFFSDLEERASRGKQLGAEAQSSSGEKLGERIGRYARSADAALTEIGSYVESLDGYDRNGPAHRLFVDARREARAKEVELDKRVLDQLRKAWANVPKKLRGTMGDTVEGLAELLPVSERYRGRVRAPETRSDLWVLFLNSGNEGNRQRIRDGNGWSDDQVTKALQLLKPEEARWLQGILDAVQSMHPELAAAYERRYGLPLGQVAPTPITIDGETFRGGYFPLRYDPRIARQGIVQESDVEESIYSPGYRSPIVYSGHTKERLEKVPAPVSLEWSVVPSHFAQVIHDVAFGDWVRQAGKVVLDDRFKALVDKSLGSERTKLFLPWLKDIAGEGAASVAGAAEQNLFLRGLSAMARSGYARAVMGLNLPSMLAHLTDPLVLLAEARGPRESAWMAGHITAAYLRVISMKGDYAPSKEIAYRDAREHNNIRTELGKMTEGHTVARVLNEVAFRLRYYVDAFHNRVIWTAGLHDGLRRGMTQDEAARHGDDLLANTLPSGDIAERSAILRSKSNLAAVLMFYGYANKMYNLWLHRPVARAVDAWYAPEATAKSRSAAVADLAAKWLAMGAIGALGGYLGGRGPGDDEDKSRWLRDRVLLEGMNSMPLLGSGAETIASALEHRPAKMDVRTAPDAQLFADGVNKFADLIRRAQQGQGGDEQAWAALDALTRAGIGQVGKSISYMHQLRTGQAQPRSAREEAAGFIYGPPRTRR